MLSLYVLPVWMYLIYRETFLLILICPIINGFNMVKKHINIPLNSGHLLSRDATLLL